MQHLSDETLARLVEEEPGELEGRHLDECEECRAELAALCEQTAMLAQLPELSPPEGEWEGVRMRLAEEGLLRPAARAPERRLLRAAAALALFVAGGAAGALLRDGGVVPPSPLATPAGGAAVAAAPARSSGEAATRLRAAESAYIAAMADYSRFSGTDQAVDPVSRLAALEGILLTTRAALKEAPADPVINGYHLAALGQRDAMLQQISVDTEEPWY